MKRLSKRVFAALNGSGHTLATAESCTGGAIASAIVSTPGASNYFRGGIVSYTNEVKERLLGVSHEVLEEQTAVCEEVARQMVQGACRALQSTYAIAITGLAGPGGGTEKIPTGTIWMACGTETHQETLRLTGDSGREQNLKRAVRVALAFFLQVFAHENDIQSVKKQKNP